MKIFSQHRSINEIPKIISFSTLGYFSDCRLFIFAKIYQITWVNKTMLFLLFNLFCECGGCGCLGFNI